jgi:hypothetical protein
LRAGEGGQRACILLIVSGVVGGFASAEFICENASAFPFVSGDFSAALSSPFLSPGL